MDRLSTARHWIALPSSAQLVEFIPTLSRALASRSLDDVAVTVQASAAVDQAISRCARSSFAPALSEKPGHLSERQGYRSSLLRPGSRGSSCSGSVARVVRLAPCPPG